jgi:hypothetical protein
MITDKLSRLIFANRKLTLLIMLVVTLVFAAGIPTVSYKTVFEDMLPNSDAFVRTFFDYRANYGNQDSVQMILVNEKGDIYNPAFLKVVDRMTREFETIPSINKERISSITSRKLRAVHTDGQTIYTDPLIDQNKPIPSDQDELDRLKVQIQSTPGVLGGWVSWNQKAVLIDGALIPGAYDYQKVFARLSVLAKDAEQTTGVKAMLVGLPTLTGWVYTYNVQIQKIMAVSIFLVLVMLVVYSRSLPIVVLSVFASAISLVWGLGLVGYLGYNLDPLILVLPLLVLSRALSHSIQMGLRYQEFQAVGLSSLDAGIAMFRKQFSPGALGVIADALGTFFIALADIPLMHKLVVFCGFWALSLIVTVLVAFPVLISFMPAPKGKNVRQKPPSHTVMNTIMSAMARTVATKTSRYLMWSATLFVIVVSVYLSSSVSMGNPKTGSPLLWQNSDYNKSVDYFNRNFIGSDQLIVVVKAASGDVRNVKYVQAMTDLQYRLEAQPQIAGSISFADMLPQIRRKLWGNYPKTGILPISDQESGSLGSMLTNGSNPGDFDRFFDREFHHASITFFVKDQSSPAITKVVDDVSNEIAKIESEYGLPGAFKLALGSVGLQAAINKEVSYSHDAILIAVTIILLLCTAIGYRSITIALILVAPLLITNYIVLATMALMGIGVDVNTLPIIGFGMGIGIDYGIYLVHRIIEDRALMPTASIFKVVDRSMQTTGSAIFFTAITMVVAVGIWYFFSDLRFQAEMGLLLALIMMINLIGALLVVPLGIISLGEKAINRSVARVVSN